MPIDHPKEHPQTLVDAVELLLNKYKKIWSSIAPC
jgi:hypothetical protein